MGSAESWRKYSGRYRKTNLVFLGDDRKPKCLFLKKSPLSTNYALENLNWKADYFELDIPTVANQLLAVDYQSLFSVLSEMNLEFRQKYPVPRTAWLSRVSREGRLSESVDFERTVAVSAKKEDSELTDVQKGEDSARIKDCELIRSKLIRQLAINSEVGLSNIVQNLFLHLTDFAFCDDLWLCRHKDPLADSLLFDLWGKECNYIVETFEEIVCMVADAPDLFDASSAFDYVVGINPFPSGDLALFLEKMDIRRGRSIATFRNLSKDEKEPFFDLSRDYRSSDPMDVENVGAAICGALIQECTKLGNDEFLRLEGIDVLKSHLASYYCASASEKVGLFKKICDEVKDARTNYRIHEAEIGQIGTYSRIGSLNAVIDIADSFFSTFYSEATASEYFKQVDGGSVMRSRGFVSPTLSNNRRIVNRRLGIQLMSIKNALNGRYWNLSIWTFPGFLAHFLSATFRFGLFPKCCKRCGGYFFSEAPNQQYCQRTASETGVRCSTVGGNEKEQYNRAKKSVAAKAIRAASKSQEVKKYYDDLSVYIQYEAGPLYMHSEYVDCAQYDEWLKKVIGPKYGPAVSMNPTERPYYMIWGNEVIEGTEWVYISKLVDLTLNPNGEMTAPLVWENVSGGVSDRCSRVRAAALFRCVLNYNKSHLGGELPVPGLIESGFYRLESSVSLDAKRLETEDWALENVDCKSRTRE